jgi:hypothetical protein
MKSDALKRMLDFLDLLRRQGTKFRIERQSPDALMVTFSLKGVCVEVDFFVNEVWFSYFKTTEEGEMTEKLLYNLLQENWAD